MSYNKEAQARYYQRNKIKRDLYNKQWAKNNPDKMKVIRSKCQKRFIYLSETERSELKMVLECFIGQTPSASLDCGIIENIIKKLSRPPINLNN